MNAELGPTCITEESFEQLVLDYQMPLKRMCYMYLHDMALAEDAVRAGKRIPRRKLMGTQRSDR